MVINTYVPWMWWISHYPYLSLSSIYLSIYLSISSIPISISISRPISIFISITVSIIYQHMFLWKVIQLTQILCSPYLRYSFGQHCGALFMNQSIQSLVPLPADKLPSWIRGVSEARFEIVTVYSGSRHVLCLMNTHACRKDSRH